MREGASFVPCASLSESKQSETLRCQSQPAQSQDQTTSISRHSCASDAKHIEIDGVYHYSSCAAIYILLSFVHGVVSSFACSSQFASPRPAHPHAQPQPRAERDPGKRHTSENTHAAIDGETSGSRSIWELVCARSAVAAAVAQAAKQSAARAMRGTAPRDGTLDQCHACTSVATPRATGDRSAHDRWTSEGRGIRVPSVPRAVV